MDAYLQYASPCAPPLDPAWLAHEELHNLRAPKPAGDILVRQGQYADECRALDGGVLAEGAGEDRALAEGGEAGISTEWIHVKSSLDGYEVPVLKYEARVRPAATAEARAAAGREEGGEGAGVVIVYYHGGGLYVGEADSEDLSCRRLIGGLARRLAKSSTDSASTSSSADIGITLYSIGYRLMPTHQASTCVADAWDAFEQVRDRYAGNVAASLVVAGSSSGGQLAAHVSLRVAAETTAASRPVTGVLLRGPVLSAASSGISTYVPASVRHLHVSAADPSFESVLLGGFRRDVPRDGLDRMPLEELAALVERGGGEVGERGKGVRLPRTFVQACTNDVLFSDAVCYAALLAEAGGEVKFDAVKGWPHTFWLKAPRLDRARKADRVAAEGLAWLVSA